MRSAGGEAAALAWSPGEAGAFALGGSGHVSTWRCAATFTGAKLQGELAHFGAHAAADVSALLVLHGGQATEPPFLCACFLRCLCPCAIRVAEWAACVSGCRAARGPQCNATHAARSPAVNPQERLHA